MSLAGKLMMQLVGIGVGAWGLFLFAEAYQTKELKKITSNPQSQSEKAAQKQLFKDALLGGGPPDLVALKKTTDEKRLKLAEEYRKKEAENSK
jgi:hypothetical protein